MAKKPTEKKVPTPEYDFERETRVLVEEARSDVKKIAEGHNSVIKRLDNIESELIFVKAAVIEVDIKVKRVEQNLDGVVTDHENRIRKLGEIGAIPQGDTLEHKKIPPEADFGRRLTSLGLAPTAKKIIAVISP